MTTIRLFYVFLTSLFASLVLIPPISRLAVSMGILDKPGKRKVHLNGTPRLGGIAIFFAFILAIFVFCDIGRQERGFLAGAVVIFLFGLADDLAELSPRQKIAGQTAAALIAVLVGNFHLSSLGNLFGTGEIGLGMFAIPFTVLAIVGVTNAINLLDGLDGLAGGVSAIAAATMALLAFNTGNMQFVGLTMALAGAVIGFLRYNSYPASIFMGDAGSLFLGYCMGAFSIMLVAGSGGAIPEAVPLMILAVPVLDTIYVIWKRMKAGRSPFLPDNNHIHHRFLDLGVGQKPTVIMIYTFTYLLAALAAINHHLPNYLLLAMLASAYPVIHYGLSKFARTAGSKRQQLIRSSQFLRDTHVCRRLVRFCRRLRSGIKYLIAGALTLSIFVPTPMVNETAVVCIFLFLLSVTLLFTHHDWGNRFLLFVLYFDGAFIIYQMENLGRYVTIFGVPIIFISHLLFTILLIIVGVKAFLRHRTTEMAGSPLEYLILFIVISVPLFPADFVTHHHLLTVTGKSIVLFVAYKLILMRQARRNRKIILATLAALFMIAVKGLV